MAAVFVEKVNFLNEMFEAMQKKLDALMKENTLRKAILYACDKAHVVEVKKAFIKGLDQGERGVLGRDADGDVRQFVLFGETMNVDDYELCEVKGLPPVVGGWDIGRCVRGIGLLPVASTAEGAKAIYDYKCWVLEELTSVLLKKLKSARTRSAWPWSIRSSRALT